MILLLSGVGGKRKPGCGLGMGYQSREQTYKIPADLGNTDPHKIHSGMFKGVRIGEACGPCVKNHLERSSHSTPSLYK